MLNRHTWLVATIMNSAGLNYVTGFQELAVSSSLNGFGLGSDPHLEGEIQKEKEQTEVIESAFLIC